jgi:ATP-binding cassette, subfamily C (CFTR/MRP), member 1
MDEATSSLDHKHDRIIQKLIETEFQNTTVLTIAHKIQTVLNYDRILVLNNGELVEFDHPQNLLQNHNSVFKALVDEALSNET